MNFKFSMNITCHKNFLIRQTFSRYEWLWSYLNDLQIILCSFWMKQKNENCKMNKIWLNLLKYYYFWGVAISYYNKKVSNDRNKLFKPSYVPEHLDSLKKIDHSNIASQRHKNSSFPVLYMGVAILDLWQPSWMQSYQKGTRIILWLFVKISE